MPAGRFESFFGGRVPLARVPRTAPRGQRFRRTVCGARTRDFSKFQSCTRPEACDHLLLSGLAQYRHVFLCGRSKRSSNHCLSRRHHLSSDSATLCYPLNGVSCLFLIPSDFYSKFAFHSPAEPLKRTSKRPFTALMATGRAP